MSLRDLADNGEFCTTKCPEKCVSNEIVELIDSNASLKASCREKDASIAELIEQLQKAEAQLAAEGRNQHLSQQEEKAK